MANIKRANTSGITKSGSAISDVPDAPTIGTVTLSGTTASVPFTAAATGGTPTSYTATSNPGSLTGTGASSPLSVSGLTSGTAYTFTVTATNSTGSAVSSASNSVTPFVADGNYESIATVTVGSGGTTTITFSSIPSTYAHLQIRGIAKGLGTNNASLGIQVNGASDSNQSPFHQLYGDGASASAAGGPASDGYTASLTGPIASTTTANVHAGFVIDILDYANTSKLKTIRSLSGADFNGSGFISLRSTVNKNIQSAITSLTLITYNPGVTNGFAQYSHFALYGIKG